MNPKTVVIGVVMGCVLLVFGLAPGLFHGFAEGVRNFIDGVHHQSPTARLDGEVRQPIVLAVVGVALIALSVAGYLSQ